MVWKFKLKIKLFFIKYPVMEGSTFVLLFDYLVSTRLGNAIAIFLGALILYGVFRLVIKIIDYIVFKRLMNSVLKAIYGDEDDDEYFSSAPASNQEDEQSQKKDKKREQIREAERIQNMENEFIGGQTRSKPKQRIVGVMKPIGKWTARVMKQWIQKHQNIDMNLVNDLGYFQALVIAERKAQGLDVGQGNKHNGGISM